MLRIASLSAGCTADCDINSGLGSRYFCAWVDTKVGTRPSRSGSNYRGALTIRAENSLPGITFPDYFYFVWMRLTHPAPGIEPGGRTRCAISSMSSVSATLDTSHLLRRTHPAPGIKPDEVYDKYYEFRVSKRWHSPTLINLII